MRLIPLSMLVGVNHLVFSTLQLRNITIAFLPPNVTSVVKPLDRGIIASFNSVVDEVFGMGYLPVGFFYYLP
jgi:hypothetical protein